MRHIDFVVYGDKDGYSAMAKTVGYPAAIAAKMVLESKYTDGFEMVGRLFINIMKAFDTVWYSDLIYKLLKLKILTAYVEFIFSYLRDRMFFV